LDKAKGKVVWKVGDFGIAHVLQSANQKVNSKRGTPRYMAPEMRDGLRYDTQVDMYSVGVILIDTHQNDQPVGHLWQRAQTDLTNHNPKIRWTARRLYREAKDHMQSLKKGRPPRKDTNAIHDLRRRIPSGVGFHTRQVNTHGNIVDGDPKKLTAFILKSTLTVIKMFYDTTKIKVRAVEYIFNRELYDDFDLAKKEFKQKRHYKKREFLTFHGTDPKNVKLYVNGFSLI